jgi:predicted tellurium resistance membrane protein TerC
MESVLSLDNLFTLGMLILLQAVLGFDNLLYISLESKRVAADKQAMVRRLGIGIAVALRVVLLFVLLTVLQYFQEPMFGINVGNYISSTFNLHSIIVLVGGAFIMYTSIKEIMHMMGVTDLEHETRSTQSTGRVIFMVVAMNLVFSFDSILSAMALSDVFWVMATAILISGALMIWLSDRVAQFLEKNRMYEVLGLFILFVVGIMLLTEGGHLAHLRLMGQEIVPMSKATFYFVIAVLVLTDIVQTRYQKRLLRAQRSETA